MLYICKCNEIVCIKDIAQLVLKKCTTTNAKEGTISQDSKEYSVMFSYEFIEDSQDAKE